jgi:hypothetical protein
MTQNPPGGGSWGPPPPHPPPPQQPWGAGQYGGQVGGPGYRPQPSAGTNALAIISLVTGIVWLFGLGSAVAVVTGIVALNQIGKRGESGTGLAIAGIALGAVGLVGMLLVIIFGVAVDDTIDEAADALNTPHAVVVRVEASPGTCWSGTFAGASREGCGRAEFSAQERFLTTASFTKKTDFVPPADTSPLTLVLLVDGVEKERRTTTADGGSVDASASVVGGG